MNQHLKFLETIRDAIDAYLKVQENEEAISKVTLKWEEDLVMQKGLSEIKSTGKEVKFQFGSEGNEL